MEIEFKRFRFLVEEITFNNYGAITEKYYGSLITDYFSNCEKFWKYIIAPLTYRIDDSIDRNNFDKKIDCRNGISPELNEIGSFHYSIFQNLFYAYFILKDKHFSYFEDFYVHLVSACDSAEEVIHILYLVILECADKSSEILEYLTEEKFIDNYAREWYKKNYANLYVNYLKKGKGISIKLPTKKSILKEYFANSEAWKKYETFSTLIRNYRNVIIHGYTIASVIDSSRNNLVPKKEKILDYKKWRQVQNVISDPIVIKNDFVSRTEQMQSDFVELKTVLNDLWEKPISDMLRFLYEEKKEKLLLKYDLKFR
jgi:hypothetical protein